MQIIAGTFEADIYLMFYFFYESLEFLVVYSFRRVCHFTIKTATWNITSENQRPYTLSFFLIKYESQILNLRFSPCNPFFSSSIFSYLGH